MLLRLMRRHERRAPRKAAHRLRRTASEFVVSAVIPTSPVAVYGAWLTNKSRAACALSNPAAGAPPGTGPARSRGTENEGPVWR